MTIFTAMGFDSGGAVADGSLGEPGAAGHGLRADVPSGAAASLGAHQAAPLLGGCAVLQDGVRGWKSFGLAWWSGS